jgi:hypothetical protein
MPSVALFVALIALSVSLVVFSVSEDNNTGPVVEGAGVCTNVGDGEEPGVSCGLGDGVGVGGGTGMSWGFPAAFAVVIAQTD